MTAAYYVKLACFISVCCKFNVVTAILPPEDEFCDWLKERCPYLKSKLSRPIDDPNKAVNVQIEFNARRLLELDDVAQRFSVQGLFGITWQMPNCATWNHAMLQSVTSLTPAAKNVTSCQFDKNELWHPEFTISNAFENGYAIEDNGGAVTVTADGEAIWRAPGKYDTMCEMNFQAFPFDVVEPEIELFILKSPKEVSFNMTGNRPLDKLWPTGTARFIYESDVWEMMESGTESLVMTENTGAFSILRFAFKMARKPQYYVMTLIVPTEMLMALQIVVFMMPSSGPVDRVAYSITVNLAFTVAQQNVNQNLPKTSQTVYLFYYVLAYMGLGAVVTIYVSVISMLLPPSSEQADDSSMIKKQQQRKIKKSSFCNHISRLRVADCIAAIVTIFLLITINIIFFALVAS